MGTKISKGSKTREPNAGLGCVMYWPVRSPLQPPRAQMAIVAEEGRAKRGPMARPLSLHPHPVSCITPRVSARKGEEMGEENARKLGLPWIAGGGSKSLTWMGSKCIAVALTPFLRSWPRKALPREVRVNPTLAIRHVLPHGCKWSGLRSTWAGRTGSPHLPAFRSLHPTLISWEGRGRAKRGIAHSGKSDVEFLSSVSGSSFSSFSFVSSKTKSAKCSSVQVVTCHLL